jgi:CHAT domain-containing protein/tetratricopeptide (TPR) repeat protein
VTSPNNGALWRAKMCGLLRFLRPQAKPARRNRTAMIFVAAAVIATFVSRTSKSESPPADGLSEARRLAVQCSSLESLGDYPRAETSCRGALTIREHLLGADNADVAESLDALATVYYDEARFDEAEDLLQRSLAIEQRVFGNHSSKTASKVHHLAVVLNDEGKYPEAETLYRRALAICDENRSSGRSEIGEIDNDLATLYDDEGRYAQAESLYLRALAVRENADGIESWQVGETLDNLATLYDAEGRYSEGIPLERRAIAIYRKVLGPEHPKLAAIDADLAGLYEDQGNFLKAGPLLERALSMLQKTLGPGHPNVAEALRDLGVLSETEGDYSGAELRYQQALDLRERAFGSNHRYVAESLNDLGSLYERERRYREAEPLLARALAIRERTLGPSHPELAESLGRMAALLASTGRTEASLTMYERTRQTLITVRRANAGLNDDVLVDLLKSGNADLRAYVRLLSTAVQNPKYRLDSNAASTKAFIVTEQMRNGLSQLALAFAAVRSVATNPEIRALVNREQQSRERWRAMTKQLAEEYGKPAAQQNTDRLSRLQQEEMKFSAEFHKADDDLRRKFPAYADLTAPDPIDVSTVTQLLDSDEALIAYLSLDDRLIAWLLRPGRLPVYRDINVKRDELASAIDRIRLSLAPSVPFDVVDAYGIYSKILKPFEQDLIGIKSLFLVPDDLLLKIPFSALVTDDSGQAFQLLAQLYKSHSIPTPEELRDLYPQMSWLAKQNLAISVLPSATCLRALRGEARRDQSAAPPSDEQPLIGIGDPVLDGQGSQRGGSMVAPVGTLSVDAIRALARLPGTRRELIAEARALGANERESLFMEERASKPWVMKLSRDRLRRARIIAFATHALIGGEITGLKEPALVLTPPSNPTDKDNGLLTTQDILGLELQNNDWLILSGCNTGASNGTGEGLSSLVRAFFYAGARSLLVSQWSVDDAATQKLMTAALLSYSKNKSQSHAETLRQAMLEVMKHTKRQAYFAHPFAWAPFVVVGESRSEGVHRAR